MQSLGSLFDTHTQNHTTHARTHNHTYNRKNKKFVKKKILCLLSFKSCTRYGHVSNIYRLTVILLAVFKYTILLMKFLSIKLATAISPFRMVTYV